LLVFSTLCFKEVPLVGLVAGTANEQKDIGAQICKLNQQQGIFRGLKEANNAF
jgi:hypothetical protein